MGQICDLAEVLTRIGCSNRDDTCHAHQELHVLHEVMDCLRIYHTGEIHNVQLAVCQERHS